MSVIRSARLFAGNHKLPRAIQIRQLDACFRADLHRVQTWRLAAHGVDSGRKNCDVLTIANQPAKKPFRDWAATNITCADKEDAFHGSHRARDAERT